MTTIACCVILGLSGVIQWLFPGRSEEVSAPEAEPDPEGECEHDWVVVDECPEGVIASKVVNELDIHQNGWSRSPREKRLIPLLITLDYKTKSDLRQDRVCLKCGEVDDKVRQFRDFLMASQKDHEMRLDEARDVLIEHWRDRGWRDIADKGHCL